MHTFPAARTSIVVCVFSFMGILIPCANVRAIPALPLINTNNIVVITSYGAVGDNATDNTTAIQSAINAATLGGTTNGLAGGTVEIPPGIYLSGSLTMANSVNLQIDAGAILRMLPLGLYPGGTTAGTTFISGSGLHDIAISGPGAIDGQGAAWWPYANTNGANRPRMISPSGCNRVLIQNITLSNSPMFHIAISGGGNSTVQGVTIRAPSSSDPLTPGHNTDACDVSGTNILVQNCNISVGDDDFTCGAGTHDVLITNNVYGNGHGISIGSYTGGGGVSNITVINCTFNGTDNGLRIKSDLGRGGLVQNISYYNISMTNVHFPIQLYAYYLSVGTPSSISPGYAASTNAATVTSTTPIYRNITYSNITATSVSGYPIGIVWARTEMPATNIVFNKVNVTGDRNFCLYNVSGAQFIDCNLNVSATSNTFALFNAQVIVANSAPGAALVKFDGLAANAYANGLQLYNAQVSLKNTNALAGSAGLTLAASTLTVSNHLNLAATTPVNFALGTNAATIAVRSNLVLNSTLNLTNGNGFNPGSYTLFTYGGSFSGSPVLGATPGTGHAYLYTLDTNTPKQVNLVVTTPPPPVFNNVTLGNGTNLILSGTGGTTNFSYLVITSTNLAQPLSQWIPSATNAFLANGNFSFTNNPAAGQKFFRLMYP